MGDALAVHPLQQAARGAEPGHVALTQHLGGIAATGPGDALGADPNLAVGQPHARLARLRFEHQAGDPAVRNRVAPGDLLDLGAGREQRGATGDRLEVTSGSNIELRWEVEHSISVAISGGGDVETLPGEDESPLPRLHGVLPAAGTLAVTARRTRPGEATVTYRLLAIGPCGDAEASVRITVKEAAPLWGLADTHSHFVAQYALGGLGVWGRTHSPPLPTELNPGLNLPTDALSELDLAVSLRPCHGPGGHFSVVGTTINLDGASNHPADGYPTFAHWPTHLGKSHQQVHLSWLKRAVDGGLRLAVCLAVNNEAWATESVRQKPAPTTAAANCRPHFP